MAGWGWDVEYFGEGSATTVIDEQRAAALLEGMLEQLGELRRVLLLAPDFTRRHSGAGELTVMLYERLKERAEVAIMPTLGTHMPMSERELEAMFPGVPQELFRAHDWRRGLARLGEVPASYIRELSGGKLDYPIYCEIAQALVEEQWDRIFSIGQLVPHEVAGIANHNKNVLVGAGGADTINKTHFLGAVCGMESIMGRAKSPVRDVFDYMSEHFIADLPLTYLLTVRAKDEAGRLVTRGLYAGDDKECFQRGARLCRETNLELLDEPLAKVVVWLDPGEFKSTWVGNKAIYRTRMALADGGQLIIVAPGVREFGEDPEINRLIREFGYRGTPQTLRMVEERRDLAANLSAAAHLIHGSSEGRFTITYCPGGLTRQEIEGVGFEYDDLHSALERYDPRLMREGLNKMPDGEEVFYISNPSLGLWGLRQHFADAAD
ncbi:lactate racemase domain-containing protein [Candidatus Sumerlaeota bacterium]